MLGAVLGLALMWILVVVLSGLVWPARLEAVNNVRAMWIEVADTVRGVGIATEGKQMFAM